MGLALFKERRIAGRRKLTGLLPGRLIFGDAGQDVICRPVDVSPAGLGIVVSNQIKPFAAGDALLLVMQETKIELRVAWGNPDFNKQDFYRYGLVTVDPSLDLEQIFLHSGCLR